ncbi:hypothetical protein VTJ49DRAFT_6354 [Mycothermus thermophilus]|uniref:2EXR domain-containing protein n=1 Tax=Humicola insolens TaxID=85995 RepID=A0ABR3VQ68_HUMIN
MQSSSQPETEEAHQPRPPPWWRLKEVEMDWPQEIPKVSLLDAEALIKTGRSVMVEEGDSWDEVEDLFTDRRHPTCRRLRDIPEDEFKLGISEGKKPDPWLLARNGLNSLTVEDLVRLQTASSTGISGLFHWNSLPEHIRAKIISLTWEPRAIIIMERTAHIFTWCYCYMIKIRSKPPVSLHINRESRKLTLEHYQPIWITRIKAVSYIRKETDVVFVQFHNKSLTRIRGVYLENGEPDYTTSRDKPSPLCKKYLRAIYVTQYMRLLGCQDLEEEKKLFDRRYTQAAEYYLWSLQGAGRD